MRNTLLAAALAAVAVPAFASDGGPSYSYLDIGYVSHDFDGGGSADGFGAGASIAINEQFHVVGDVARVSDSGVSLTLATFAGGYAFPISGTTDVVGRIGYANARLDAGTIDASENGWMAQIGLRSLVSSSVELNGFVTHTDIGGSETGLSFGLVKAFTDRAGALAGVGFSDGDVSVMVGARFSF